MTDPATVAAGLSKAQRQALLLAEETEDGRLKLPGRVRQRRVYLSTVRLLRGFGLCTAYPSYLTEAGLAVRKILEAQDG